MRTSRTRPQVKFLHVPVNIIRLRFGPGSFQLATTAFPGGPPAHAGFIGVSGMKETERPPGFEPFRPSSPFLDLIGPVYSKTNGAGITIGLRIEERHCNRRGTLHGGVLTSIADVTLGYSAGHGQADVQLTSIAFNIEFLGPAALGRWVEWIGTVTKFGRNLAHAQCVITSEGRDVARATGMFLVHRPAQTISSDAHRSNSSNEGARYADDHDR